jgi:TM2 domain-containing membrane protein YozV
MGMGVGRKSKGVAYLLWFLGFFGVLGLHRFYLGKVGTGLLWLFTFGVCGIGAFIDLFTLGTQVDVANALHR